MSAVLDEEAANERPRRQLEAIARIRWATALAAMLAAAGLAGCGGDDEAGGASAAGSAGSEAPEIAFGRGGDIWAMNADGSDQTKLTDAPRAGGDTAPAWSPDGERIAFSRWEDGESAIWVINADGSDAEQVISGGKTRWDPDEGTLIAGRLLGSPAFSPDGKRIAFGQIDKAEEGKAVEAIYVMNADGSDVTQLTQGPFDNAPAWSPDGQRIVFSRGRPSHDGQYLITDIYVMNADGSGQTRLTSGPELEGVNLSGPTFSPDGEKIAFLGAEEGEYPRLWMMNADGSDPAPLKNRPRTGLGGSAPAWAPGGQRIAVAGDLYGRQLFGIFVMNADGTDQAKIPGTRMGDGNPAWSPLYEGEP